MMEKREFDSAFLCKRSLCIWPPSGRARGLIHIVHGMAEHIERYGDFAEFLSENGFAVVGFNHQGHGEDSKALGYFSEKDGYPKLLEDMDRGRQLAQSLYPDCKYILLGHSMGSFLARAYVLSYKLPDMLILSGTGYVPRMLARTLRVLSAAACALGKGKQASKLLDSLAFSGHNKTCENPLTPFDWLSRDDDEVKKYIDDPYCGFAFTNAAYRDLGDLFLRLSGKEAYDLKNKHMPVFLFSGAKDPVGGFGKGVKKVAESFKEKGSEKVFTLLYRDARHEMLNELNKHEVYEDVLGAVIKNI